MHDLELGPDQPVAAVLGTRTDELGLAHGDRDAAVGPRLGYQMQARHDLARSGVGHHGGVGRRERRVAAFEQVAGPVGQVVIRGIAVLRPQRVADERGEWLGVDRGGGAEDQTVAQVTGKRGSGALRGSAGG
jgi:hypothetical protein